MGYSHFVKIEYLEKMAMRPHGQLKSGKQFFLAADHPAHNTFTGQEHAEVAHKLHNESIHAQHKAAEYAHSNEHENHRIKNLAVAAKAHAEAAKAKGLPKHNNPPKR